MEKKYDFEQVIYEREHLSHDMFAQMDWERDSIMREIDRPAVPQLPVSGAQK